MNNEQRPNPFRPRGGGRPPWWPEGEPWPPNRGPGHGGQGWFLRRMLFVLGGLLLFAFFTGIVIGHLATEGDGEPSRSGPPGLVLLMAMVLVFFLGRRFVRRTAAPIGDVMSAARRVAAGDYSARVTPKGNREVRDLAESFNTMIARLHSNETLRRNLLADVAHELRTPLSVIQGNVEGMLDGIYPRDDTHLTPILDQTAVMSRLLDDLRTLSLVEAGVFKLHREPTDLEELVADLVAAHGPRAHQLGITLTGTVPDMPLVELDPVRLRQVLENLLANALRYTPLGGTIRIDVFWDGRAVFITVADTGIGIAAEHLPHLFDRFWKSADSGGSGLGLAIARTLVEAHGGQIHAESVPGRGTTLRIHLPIPVPAVVPR
ncbi:MAG: HAMP domain-containing histidine kinase [Chloroflexota bacterium]|nr:HAMP domain-containing histidine kinase [Chloroflexota bacterium]